MGAGASSDLHGKYLRLVAMLQSLFLITLGWLFTIVRLMLSAVRQAELGATRNAFSWVALALLIAASPVMGWQILLLQAAHSAKHRRVPPPLAAARTEYQVERAWGIGLPGDNETGFVVYDLDADSVAELRVRGVAAISPPARGRWLSTPMTIGPDAFPGLSANATSAEKVRFAEVLDRYGFPIDVDPQWLWRADQVANTRGSFYADGPGGSLTLIDVAHGRIYFLYAG